MSKESKEKKNVIPLQEAMDIVRSMQTALEIQNQIGFADIPGDAPTIEFKPDDTSYYDGENHRIHIGIRMIIDMFHPETEASLLDAVSYIRQHEEQHGRSTAAEPYAIGIQKGTEEVLEYISLKEEPTKRRFRKESDYENFANNVCPSLGINISFRQIQSTAMYIANSLEDGRIERIRASRMPGFARQRLYYRGLFWDQDHELKPYDDIKDDPVEKLSVILSNILSLATCQVYVKGFLTTYVDTPMFETVDALKQNIKNGIMASKTRDMATETREICKKLAPFIYEACKLSEEDMKMKEMLEKLFKEIEKALKNLQKGGVNEKNEDVDTEQIPSFTFPESNLSPSTSEEQQDNDKQGQGQSEDGQEGKDGQGSEQSENGQGNEQQGKDGQGSGQSEDRQENKQKGDNGQGSGQSKDGYDQRKIDPDKSGKKPSKGGQNNKRQGHDGQGQGQEQSKNRQNKKQQGDDGQGQSADEQCQEEQSQLPPTKEESNGGQFIQGKNRAGKGEIDVNALRKAMKEAAESSELYAKRMMEGAREGGRSGKHSRDQEIQNNDAPITPESVKDLCPHFQEVRREYKVNDSLPSALAAKGRTMNRKNRQYFKSLSTPNTKFLDSGVIDPSRIYGLSFGDTEVFQKKGKDKHFDGCAYILIDNSGSMAGDKRREACKAAAIIEESFRGLIPIKIVAFDEGNRDVIHEVVKGWEEKLQKNCCWNFYLHGRSGGGNADGYDILIATRELLARPEQKKMLIVLSDGMPSGTTAEMTKGAIQKARKKGVSVVGIYFEDGCIGRSAGQFKNMYEKDYIITEAQKLTDELSAVMKKFSRS